jgi:hypothetical protein
MDSSNTAPRHTERWRTLYQSAVLEPDHTLLFARIEEARVAILRQVETLPLHPTGEERRALSTALRTLEALEGVAHRRKA